MAAIGTMEEKFAHEVGDIYDAEHRFLEAMREMLGLAGDAKVKKLLKDHIKETAQQIRNLEGIYELLGKKPRRVKCAASAGLVAEGRKCVEEAEESPAIRDCLIAGAQAKAEHYEIASYRGLIAGAELMGQAEALALLRANLEQEEATAARVEEVTPALLKKAIKATGEKKKAAAGSSGP